MTTNELINVFWHPQHTGSFMWIQVPDVFAPDAKYGVFFKKTGNWYCCGTGKKIHGAIVFNVWLDDNSTPFEEGPKPNDQLKVFTYENNQWYELYVTKIFQKVTGNLIINTDYFLAGNMDYLEVKNATDTAKHLSNITPSINPAILEQPEIVCDETYEFTAVAPNPIRNFSFQPFFKLCTLKTVKTLSKQNFVNNVRLANGKVVIDVDPIKVSKIETESFIVLEIVTKPENPNYGDEFAKTITVKVTPDEPMTDGTIFYYIDGDKLRIGSSYMITKDIQVIAGKYQSVTKKYQFQEWFNLYNRNLVDIAIPLSVLPKDSNVRVYLSEFKRYVTISKTILNGKEVQ